MFFNASPLCNGGCGSDESAIRGWIPKNSRAGTPQFKRRAERIMRILVADDNLVFQAVLQSMLTQWGYDVVVAGDGAEAWCRLQNENGLRLVILDWVMPGLDGIEMCRRIRASKGLQYTYVLILTAKTGSEDLATAMGAGADDYVTKPFKSVELKARLRVACRILELQEKLQLGCPPLLLAPSLPGANAAFASVNQPSVRAAIPA